MQPKQRVGAMPANRALLSSPSLSRRRYCSTGNVSATTRLATRSFAATTSTMNRTSLLGPAAISTSGIRDSFEARQDPILERASLSPASCNRIITLGPVVPCADAQGAKAPNVRRAAATGLRYFLIADMLILPLGPAAAFQPRLSGPERNATLIRSAPAPCRRARRPDAAAPSALR